MGTSDSSSKPERASLWDPGGRRGPGEKRWPLRKDPRGPLAFGLTLGTSAGPELLRGGGHCFKRSGRDGRPLSCCSLFCGQRVVGLECIPVEGAQPSGLSSVPSPLPPSPPTAAPGRGWALGTGKSLGLCLWRRLRRADLRHACLRSVGAALRRSLGARRLSGIQSWERKRGQSWAEGEGKWQSFHFPQASKDLRASCRGVARRTPWLKCPGLPQPGLIAKATAGHTRTPVEGGLWVYHRFTQDLEARNLPGG